MLTSRRMLSLLLAAAAVIAILSGCYAAPVSETTERGNSDTPTVGPEISTATYPVPEENIRVFGNMAASASTGGFWQWDTFFRPYIQAYDPVTRRPMSRATRTAAGIMIPPVMPASATCSLWWNTGETTMRWFIRTTRQPRRSSRVRCPAARCRPSQAGSRKTRMRHADVCCAAYPWKAYVISNRETYELTEGVQLTAVAQESSLVSVDLQTGEISTILENCDNYDLYGVWEDIAVLRVLEMAEDAPEFEDWLAQQPEGTAWNEYDRQFIRYRFLTRNLQTGEESVLVDTSENFVRTVDPHRSWGQYAVYQVDRSIYVYDMERQTAKEVFTYDQDWEQYNYSIMDGHVSAICGTEDTCRAWAIDIMDGSVVELDTYGENVVAFSAHYECNGYFVGLLHASNNADQYYISKEDYYRSNYDAAFR